MQPVALAAASKHRLTFSLMTFVFILVGARIKYLISVSSGKMLGLAPPLPMMPVTSKMPCQFGSGSRLNKIRVLIDYEVSRLV